MHAHRTAAFLGVPKGAVTFTARWGGLNGRRLSTRMQPNRVPLSRAYTAHEYDVTSTITAKASEIPDRLVELVREQTRPLFEVFDFYAAPDSLYEHEVGEVLVRERSTI